LLIDRDQLYLNLVLISKSQRIVLAMSILFTV